MDNSLHCTSHGADDETVHNVRKTLSLLENQHHLTLLVVFCIAGMCDGLVQCFLLWHVANFGGTPLFLGILTVVFYGSSILAFYTNHRSVQLVGHIWIFAICLACLVVVFVSYAFINNPWYFLPAQFLVGVSRAAFQGVMISYFATNIPVSSLATVQGLVHGLYFGIGVGSGCVIGGALIQLTSPTMTFLVFAATAAVGLLLTVFVKICTKQPDYLAEEYTEVEGTNDEERACTSEHRR
ncbi:major facilitator superfamily domain-containing protein 6-like isoform X2 [Ptychodera flava]|uniref:major facilitator superfamily domain-containing protein 6-like isoform X2 n=1 Tax=Ptychodera flava TaxID=63121 RepID=UPI00396A18CF